MMTESLLMSHFALFCRSIATSLFGAVDQRGAITNEIFPPSLPSLPIGETNEPRNRIPHKQVVSLSSLYFLHPVVEMGPISDAFPEEKYLAAWRRS